MNHFPLVITDHLPAFYSLIKHIYQSQYLHGIVFWDTRVAASRLTDSQTRLPDIPDQTAFLNHWYDWHRGYTMAENEQGVQHRQNLIGESLSDVAPGQLPRNQFGQATLVAGDQDEVATQSSRDSPPLDEPDMDPEDRLFDSAPSSPQFSTTESTPSNQGQFITEEDSMPPSLREARPFLRPASPLVSSAASADAHLRDLRAVLADTSQTEIETIRVEQEARERLNDANRDIREAAERLDITRTVSRNTQRRIRQHENANRVFGTREQVESQGDDYVSPITAMFDRFGPRTAAQRSAAGDSAVRNSTQAARSHSHPSRRDESRTDQSLPSNSSLSQFSTNYLGPLNPRVSELYPSAADRMMLAYMRPPQWPEVETPNYRARENLHPRNNSTSHSRQAGVQTSSIRDPLVFANLTNAVERSRSRALRRQPSNEDRMFLGRQGPVEFRPQDFRWSGRYRSRPQDPSEELDEVEQNREELERGVVEFPRRSRRLAPRSPPINTEEANRRLSDASTTQPMSAEERNRRFVESNAWNPQSSDPESSVEYANANPFGPGSLDNYRSNPLMLGARVLYSTDRRRANLPPGTADQDMINMKPPPKTKAEMTVDIECRICMEQPATVACLPCGNNLDDS